MVKLDNCEASGTTTLWDFGHVLPKKSHPQKDSAYFTSIIKCICSAILAGTPGKLKDQPVAHTGFFPQRCGGYPEITRFLTVGHAAWGASWNGGDGLRSCCLAMFLWMKKKTHPERSAGKDVGLQTVNSNPMLEKIRSVGKNLTGKSAAIHWFWCDPSFHCSVVERKPAGGQMSRKQTSFIRTLLRKRLTRTGWMNDCEAAKCYKLIGALDSVIGMPNIFCNSPNTQRCCWGF